MIKLGFACRWVDWIMTCVTSVRYTVKFNGTLLDSFAPSCGLRQGDPLSPFLFLCVADGLSALLRKGIENQSLQALRVCPRAPAISHLLFADDTLLFFKANPEQANFVKGVISRYAQATGQLINPQKCSIQFGDSCPIDVQQEVRQILEVVQEEFESKYLGLPTPDGRMHRGKFQNLQERLTQRILIWGEHYFSTGKGNFH